MTQIMIPTWALKSAKHCLHWAVGIPGVGVWVQESGFSWDEDYWVEG